MGNKTVRIEQFFKSKTRNFSKSMREWISELFVPNTTVHTYNTRNKHNLRPKQSNRVYMYKNFSFIGVHIWNDIQKRIKFSVSYSAFKHLTRTYYLYNNPKYLTA